MLKKIFKILIVFLLSLTGLILLLIMLVFTGIKPKSPAPPTAEQSIYLNEQVAETDSGIKTLQNNWIRKNRFGVWELYIEGDAFNRGVAAGKLSEDLVKYQEEVFVEEINRFIPSRRYQKILITIIAWMNRNLTSTVPQEYLKEIYGISLSASSEFNSFGTAYERLLNYHAAHDIGHAFQSYYLVGCSSFAAWDGFTSDSSLIIGRNFDFYFGNDFARNKIIEFVAPESGYNFAFVTWGGMIGVISGMNDQGLTVTINAGTLEIGMKSATPVTFVAREILQYAKNIDEAIAIARSRNIMVSESFLIGSAFDRKVAVIEKKPGNTSVTWPDSSALICTNHFQSSNFVKDESNIKNREENATGYRFIRIEELMNDYRKLSVTDYASILRDKKGANDKNIGLGNEKAVNQLLAHHSVIFQPEKRIMWISTSSNTLGEYLAYDLNKIFSDRYSLKGNSPIDKPELTIPADNFLYSQEFKNFQLYKNMRDSISEMIDQNKILNDTFTDSFIDLNPEYYETYKIIGDYFFSIKNYDLAYYYYNVAVSKEVNSASALEYLNNQIRICMKELS
ncbi:MAG: choloylglycine hydrolase [Bacteroidales bacterium]|nr:choloylglycine hydrolase [Bacteroidales bacterium]